MVVLKTIDGLSMRNKDLVESSSDGIFAFDRDLQLTICNRVIRNLLGVSKGECLNSPLFENIVLLDKSVDEEDLTNVLLGESIVKNNKVFFDETNRVYVHFSLELSPVFDDKDIIVGGMGVVKQIQKFGNGLSSNDARLKSTSTQQLLPKIVFDVS